MATTFNGIYLDDRNNGLTDIGDDGAVCKGVGSLTVNGGNTLDLTSTNLAILISFRSCGSATAPVPTAP